VQPPGDQDLCPAAGGSVEPVMNQAGLQWRIEKKGIDIEKNDMFGTKIV